MMQKNSHEFISHKDENDDELNEYIWSDDFLIDTDISNLRLSVNKSYFVHKPFELVQFIK